jgi:hypothetical protein
MGARTLSKVYLVESTIGALINDPSCRAPDPQPITPCGVLLI